MTDTQDALRAELERAKAEIDALRRKIAQTSQPIASPLPNGVIKDMYLQINNISQGLNMGLFVLVFSNEQFFATCRLTISVPFLALTSFLIAIIFWARYYFDTEILRRSFTLLSVLWFFAYIVSQGISISLMSQPAGWFASTGVFLFFGAGFYGLNLYEMRRKQAAGVLTLPPGFESWQSRRLIELATGSLMAFFGTALLARQPALSLAAALLALAVAVWQLIVTNDYRRCNFIETGF